MEFNEFDINSRIVAHYKYDDFGGVNAFFNFTFDSVADLWN